MSKDILFLLNPNFYDGEDGPFFCPHSAAMEGLLKYAPEILEKVEVQRIEFKRPRPDIIALLGEENQNTPVLIITEEDEIPTEAQVSATTGRAFIVGEIEISKFLHKKLGTIKPH
jgi:hypothetical protein